MSYRSRYLSTNPTISRSYGGGSSYRTSINSYRSRYDTSVSSDLPTSRSLSSTTERWNCATSSHRSREPSESRVSSSSYRWSGSGRSYAGASGGARSMGDGKSAEERVRLAIGTRAALQAHRAAPTAASASEKGVDADAKLRDRVKSDKGSREQVPLWRQNKLSGGSSKSGTAVTVPTGSSLGVSDDCNDHQATAQDSKIYPGSEKDQWDKGNQASTSIQNIKSSNSLNKLQKVSANINDSHFIKDVRNIDSLKGISAIPDSTCNGTHAEPTGNKLLVRRQKSSINNEEPKQGSHSSNSADIQHVAIGNVSNGCNLVCDNKTHTKLPIPVARNPAKTALSQCVTPKRPVDKTKSVSSVEKHCTQFLSKSNDVDLDRKIINGCKPNNNDVDSRTSLTDDSSSLSETSDSDEDSSNTDDSHELTTMKLPLDKQNLNEKSTESIEKPSHAMNKRQVRPTTLDLRAKRTNKMSMSRASSVSRDSSCDRLSTTYCSKRFHGSLREKSASPSGRCSSSPRRGDQSPRANLDNIMVTAPRPYQSPTSSKPHFVTRMSSHLCSERTNLSTNTPTDANTTQKLHSKLPPIPCSRIKKSHNEANCSTNPTGNDVIKRNRTEKCRRSLSRGSTSRSISPGRKSNETSSHTRATSSTRSGSVSSNYCAQSNDIKTSHESLNYLGRLSRMKPYDSHDVLTDTGSSGSSKCNDSNRSSISRGSRKSSRKAVRNHAKCPNRSSSDNSSNHNTSKTNGSSTSSSSSLINSSSNISSSDDGEAYRNKAIHPILNECFNKTKQQERNATKSIAFPSEHNQFSEITKLNVSMMFDSGQRSPANGPYMCSYTDDENRAMEISSHVSKNDSNTSDLNIVDDVNALEIVAQKLIASLENIPTLSHNSGTSLSNNSPVSSSAIEQDCPKTMISPPCKNIPGYALHCTQFDSTIVSFHTSDDAHVGKPITDRGEHYSEKMSGESPCGPFVRAWWDETLNCNEGNSEVKHFRNQNNSLDYISSADQVEQSVCEDEKTVKTTTKFPEVTESNASECSSAQLENHSTSGSTSPSELSSTEASQNQKLVNEENADNYQPNNEARSLESNHLSRSVLIEAPSRELSALMDSDVEIQSVLISEQNVASPRDSGYLTGDLHLTVEPESEITTSTVVGTGYIGSVHDIDSVLPSLTQPIQTVAPVAKNDGGETEVCNDRFSQSNSCDISGGVISEGADDVPDTTITPNHHTITDEDKEKAKQNLSQYISHMTNIDDFMGNIRCSSIDTLQPLSSPHSDDTVADDQTMIDPQDARNAEKHIASSPSNYHIQTTAHEKDWISDHDRDDEQDYKEISMICSVNSSDHLGKSPEHINLGNKCKNIVDDLRYCTRSELHRVLDSLKSSIQTNAAMTEQFLEQEGLAALMTAADRCTSRDHVLVLRVVGQLMLREDGMRAVLDLHNRPVLCWLYSLLDCEASKTQDNECANNLTPGGPSCQRLVDNVITCTLHLLLILMDYTRCDCRPVLEAIHSVDLARGVVPWSAVMWLLGEGEPENTEHALLAARLINKCLFGIAELNCFYDQVDCIEQLAMETTIARYIGRPDAERALSQQLQLYEAVVRHEDGDSTEGLALPHDAEFRRSRRVESLDVDPDGRRSLRHQKSGSEAATMTPSSSLFHYQPAGQSWSVRDRLKVFSSGAASNNSHHADSSTSSDTVVDSLPASSKLADYSEAERVEQVSASQERLSLNDMGMTPALRRRREQQQQQQQECSWKEEPGQETKTVEPPRPECNGNGQASITSSQSSVKDLRERLVRQGGIGVTLLSPDAETAAADRLDQLSGVVSKAKEGLLLTKSPQSSRSSEESTDERQSHPVRPPTPVKSEMDLHWENIERSLQRPLMLGDLDFTDLTEADESENRLREILAGDDTSRSSRDSPLQPPPPPPLPSLGVAPPPPAAPPPLPAAPPPPLLSQNGQNFVESFQSQQQTSRWSVTSQSSTPPPSDAKQRKTVKLFWKEIRNDLLSSNQSTIWDELPKIDLDTSKLEVLFESKAKDSTIKRQQESKTNKEIIVLGHKRSNAINICMTKLPPPRAIKAAILKMDATVINKDGIEKLMILMPSEEELSAINEAQAINPELPLGSAENFLLTLGSINEISARLKLWLFKLDYDNVEKEVADTLMDLKQGLEKLTKNETFKRILAMLRGIGNFLNCAQTRGFSLDYLTKLPEVKDTVHKHSLLHHLCTMVTQQFPNSTDLYSEIGEITRASRVDFGELVATIRRMESECKASWDHLKVIAKYDGPTQIKQKMSEFLADSAERIIVLGIVHRRVKTRFFKFLRWLGVPAHQTHEQTPTHLCRVLSEFALEYRTTRDRVLQQLAKNATLRPRLSIGVNDVASNTPASLSNGRTTTATTPEQSVDVATKCMTRRRRRLGDVMGVTPAELIVTSSRHQKQQLKPCHSMPSSTMAAAAADISLRRLLDSRSVDDETTDALRRDTLRRDRPWRRKLSQTNSENSLEPPATPEGGELMQCLMTSAVSSRVSANRTARRSRRSDVTSDTHRKLLKRSRTRDSASEQG